MSELPPSTRARILQAVDSTPALTRRQWLARQWTWLSAALVVFVALAFRHGMQPVLERPSTYVWTLSLALGGVALWLAAEVAAFMLTPLGPAPGSLRLVRRATVPALALAALVANLLAPETLRPPMAQFWVHTWCPLLLLGSGLAVSGLALRATRCADPPTSRAHALVCAAFIGTLAALAVSLQCEFSDPVHVLATHVLPVGVLVRVVLRWVAARE